MKMTNTRRTATLVLVLLLLVAATSVSLIHADVYLHSPPGSNNRLNEDTNNRRNNDRLFNSQNNAKGGYNVGENCPNGNVVNPATGQPTGTAGCTGDSADLSKASQQGSLKFFEGSKVYVEWTNQHGCGATQGKTYCQLVLQYMCWPGSDAAPVGYEGDATGLTDGTTPVGNQPEVGVHEPQAYYTKCATRSANKGLYHADQTLPKNAKAINTRQNPNGNRSGSECQEERDYYPYWHPSPWRDIAVFTDEPGRCDYYKRNSMNSTPKYECACTSACTANSAQATACWQHNTADGCGGEQGCQWVAKTHANFWDTTFAPMGSQPPLECIETFWNRDNHLGDNPSGINNYYWWSVPNIAQACGSTGDDCTMCALRLRYNITTGDLNNLQSWQVTTAGVYDSLPKPIDYFSVDSRLDGEQTVVMDGVTNAFYRDPEVDVGVGGALRLAVNTAQYGRTFQDRSHKIQILSRSKWNVNTDQCVFNVMVRGKRGNIVQVYPAVEYDFTPNHLIVYEGDVVNWQWAGSNNEPRGNDGEGKAGTDRNNIVELENRFLNTPKAWVSSDTRKLFSDRSEAIRFATAGKCSDASACSINPTLDDAPAYFTSGLKKFPFSGTWHYMCTRNNNFSNRSEKATLEVTGTRDPGNCYARFPPELPRI